MWLAQDYGVKFFLKLIHFFFNQIGQFIMCHGPLWAKFRVGTDFGKARVCIRASAHSWAPMVSR